MYSYVMFDNDEVFKPILNKDGSKTKYSISNFGNIYNHESDKLVSPYIATKWYLSSSYWNKSRQCPKNKYRACVTLTFDDWSYKGAVARLELMTFHPLDNYDNMECDHINDDPRDDRLENLQWITSVDNKIKSATNRNRGYTDYSEDTVRRVIELIIVGKGSGEIAKELNVNPRLVNDIQAGRSHKDISKQYLDKGFEYRRQTSEQMFDRQQLVRQICEYIDFGMSNSEIRMTLNLPKNDACLPNDIRKLKIYRHISKDYNFYKEYADDSKKELKYYKKVFL